MLGLTIDGVTQYFKNEEANTLTLSKVINGFHTFTFKVLSDGSYRPVKNKEVIFTENGTRRFGGILTYILESSTVQEKPRPELTFDLTASSFNSHASRRFVNESFALGTTLKTILTQLTTYLSTYSVTLSGSQVNGPAMPAIEFVYTRLDEALNSLSTLTAEVGEAYVWTIDENKVLSMFQPSTTAAPFNITSDVDADLYSDLEVEKAYEENYANRVIVLVPTVQQDNRSESFTGDGVSTVYQLQYTVLTHHNNVTLSTGGGELLMNTPADPGIPWEYDPVANTITRVGGATVNGTIYTFTFDGEFTGFGQAEDAGEIASEGLTEVVLSVDTVPTDATAQSLANAELARRLSSTTTVSYTTKSVGIEPGQSQTITSVYRNINAVFTITEVVFTTDGDLSIKRRVTAVASTKRVGSDNWRETYKRWDKDTVGGVGTVTGSGTAPASAALPFESVQYNDSGVFGGNAAFTFDKTTHSMVMGDSSSITAASVESCFVMGEDCHITD